MPLLSDDLYLSARDASPRTGESYEQRPWYNDAKDHTQRTEGIKQKARALGEKSVNAQGDLGEAKSLKRMKK
jgi:hypothetical protein